MTVVTRFAPSPTGYLHIGGARTALYNWLFAKHHACHGTGGKFFLRIEDTDRARSTQEAVDAIYAGLTWLGLDWEGEPVSQFARADLHRAAAERLLAEGKAYRCYCSTEELAAMREAARKEGRQRMYDGTWRDRDPADAPKGVDPVIRLKAPLEGETVIEDRVQGRVTVANAQLDDMVLLRADGTPTYMLAVVVDDHDMGITHVIRGDDHLTNAFRQTQLYLALGWDAPQFAHIPLIHGQDGAKLSKRHGALGVEAYRDAGFLPETLRNYLLRLGWGHGDDEIISTDQAIDWFGLENVGKSAARFDIAKLTNLNGHYIREADDARLVELVMERLEAGHPGRLAKDARDRLFKGMAGLKERAKTISELSENSTIYALQRPIEMTEKAQQQLGADGLALLRGLRPVLDAAGTWNDEALMATTREFAEAGGHKLGAVAQPVRAALTGSTVSPSVFEIMDVLGREETLGRLDDVLAGP
ncbi:MAG: glutamate--tRNA ligase [Rhodospirillales bacterium CG15_BIG_FIL_POST_REV_8_21_14_020_66_15]|nr:MAG: glutamate--tRNA ligase [Rhodospirillales bacterium CG15_BIG_FIL_POST_REV_8_21_14_020_66_15]